MTKFKENLKHEIHHAISNKVMAYYGMHVLEETRLPDNFEVLLPMKTESVKAEYEELLRKTFYYFLLSPFYKIELKYDYCVGKTPMHKYSISFERK